MNATTTTAAQVTTAAVQAGDMVWGRPVREGKTGARRKGIVLGDFGDTTVIVWWFGQGAASMKTSTMMFRNELTKCGDVFELKGQRALKLARDTYHFERAHAVGRMLERHGRRMRSIGC
jgi:hypothetical protein